MSPLCESWRDPLFFWSREKKKKFPITRTNWNTEPTVGGEGGGKGANPVNLLPRSIVWKREWSDGQKAKTKKPKTRIIFHHKSYRSWMNS